MTWESLLRAAAERGGFLAVERGILVCNAIQFFNTVQSTTDIIGIAFSVNVPVLSNRRVFRFPHPVLVSSTLFAD